MSQTVAHEYCQKAEQCRAQASKAVSAADRAEWLRMVAEWQSLADNLSTSLVHVPKKG
jgi:hypothetical protein